MAGSADGDEEGSHTESGFDFIEIFWDFAKPNNVGSHAAVSLAVPADFRNLDIAGAIGPSFTPGALLAEELPVHVEDILRATPFVEVIDVLGDQGEGVSEVFFEFGQSQMGFVRGDLCELVTAVIVEAVDRYGVFFEGFEGGYFFDGSPLPKTTAIPESLQSGLCRDSSSGKDGDGFHRFGQGG